MAERRMFAKTIIDSDAFLDMPLSTQALYFHLSMRADDDGFINNAKKIQRMLGCADDDLKILLAKNFVIPFETGVCVIKHWKVHNYIQKDRYKPTVYTDEKEKLSTKNNDVYTMDTQCIQDVSSLEAQVRLGKVSLGKESKGKYIPPIPTELLYEWKQHRKNKPVTERVIKTIEFEANKIGWTLTQAIECCCANSWQGFKAEWVNKQSSFKSVIASREELNRQNTEQAYKELFGDENIEKDITHESIGF